MAEAGAPKPGEETRAKEQVEARVPEQEEASGLKRYAKSLAAGVTYDYVLREVLLGITICFAQIPESVAFAFMAHIKPPIALHAAWMVGLICSVFGGRPGMVNGATGAFAAIIGTFIPPGGTGNNGQGVELLFPSVMLAGLLMLCVSRANLARFITLLPAPVMIGFCNGLAIVIGMAQLHPFTDEATHEWKSGFELMWMLIICITSMLVMEFLPKIPLKLFREMIPSSLVAIVIAIVIEFGIVRNVGSRTNVIRDVSEFTSDTAFPVPFFHNTAGASYDYSSALAPEKLGETFTTIFIQGALLCVVGSIESLMTSEVVEFYAKTPSDGSRTLAAMGVGNLLSGFFGGMGGNAMIGLSTVNCLNGGRGRLGPTCTALGIMACVMGAYPLLNYIPVAALAGIMLVVVLHTFKWFSVLMMVGALLPKRARDKLGPKFGHKVPRIEVFVIFIVTLLSNYPKGTNIAYAVGVGVSICAINFAWTSGKAFEWKVSYDDNGTKYYDVTGPLFFGATSRFFKVMDPDQDPENVEVRFSDTTSVMDYSALEAMHKASALYRSKKKQLVFKSLCPASEKMIAKANRLCSAIEYTARTIDVTPVGHVAPLGLNASL
eukprot:CAMPEP_0198522994 /NCGR_PEP_ID=MMETSP1462-20131121/21862_1 /TAXON_ID=1333877 /ORGANISM="Brandtodinium nutriculum, Strain RCC3387" /LENGTH=604 /DNA_ID=CAMNT_0044252671 /DNA_START=27 /DNA_END=1841 /DNA_ORIENTATION=+